MINIRKRKKQFDAITERFRNTEGAIQYDTNPLHNIVCAFGHLDVLTKKLGM